MNYLHFLEEISLKTQVIAYKRHFGEMGIIIFTESN